MLGVQKTKVDKFCLFNQFPALYFFTGTVYIDLFSYSLFPNSLLLLLLLLLLLWLYSLFVEPSTGFQLFVGDQPVASPLPTDKTHTEYGRAVAQEVSRRLPTDTAQVRARVTSRLISVGQSGTGAGFIQVLLFPLPLIHPTDCSTIVTIIQGW
jgi:hypothetical protein